MAFKGDHVPMTSRDGHGQDEFGGQDLAGEVPAPAVNSEDFPSNYRTHDEITAEQKLLDATRRQGWLASPERQSLNFLRKVALAWIVLCFALYVASYFAWQKIEISPNSSEFTILFVMSVSLSRFAYFTLIRRQKGRYEDRILLESAKALDNREAELVSQDEASIKELWKLTNERLRGYHERAYRQADQSFRNAQIAIFGGFLIVAGTAGIAAWKTTLTTSSSVVIGVIGTVGAGLATYVARTFLRLQETTSTAMKGYFAQPQETFRYLVAERLIDRLPEDQRAQTVEYLVQAVMLAGSSIEQAQAGLSAPQGQQGGQQPGTGASGQGAGGSTGGPA